MKFDRTFAHRHDAAAGVATMERRAADSAALASFDFGAGAGSLAQFDRLAAGLTAQHAAAAETPSLVDEPTREMPRIVDFGAGRADSAGVVHVRVRTADRALT